MGWQTALNLASQCEEMGIWEEHNVRMIGVDTKAIDITENREAFRKLLQVGHLDERQIEIEVNFLRTFSCVYSP